MVSPKLTWNMVPLIWLVLFSFLASACPPLLNDFTYLGNDTHTTADLVRGLFENDKTQLGWSEIVTKTGYPVQVWPGGVIPFCFQQPVTREHLEFDLHEAWSLWSDRLGPKGKDSGHVLEFREFDFPPNTWPYCYKERKNDDDPWEWNPSVPYSVATVWEALVRVTGYNPNAVVGWIPQDWPRGQQPGRMGIRVNLHQAGDYGTHEAWVAALAHELGHVFGFWHEHQRPDRDHYVRFNCAALPGYDEARDKVIRSGQHTMEQVCADSGIAALYDFSDIKDFDTIDHLDPGSPDAGSDWYWRQNFPDRDYDEASIMHYDSHVAHWNRPEEKLYARLAFWYYRGPDYEGPKFPKKEDLEFIYTNFVPSEDDIKGLKKLYPWTE